jgi:hypothetical protein
MNMDATQSANSSLTLRFHLEIASNKVGSLISEISFFDIKERDPGVFISRTYSFIALIATNNQMKKMAIEPTYVKSLWFMQSVLTNYC